MHVSDKKRKKKGKCWDTKEFQRVWTLVLKYNFHDELNIPPFHPQDYMTLTDSEELNVKIK
jgi:hypothetical protein